MKPGRVFVVGNAVDDGAMVKAVAAARMGAKVYFIGAFSNDEGATETLDAMKAEGIDVRRCIRKKGSRPILTPDDVRELMPAHRESDCILGTLGVPVPTLKAASEQTDVGRIAGFIVDAKPYPKKGWPKRWRHCCGLLAVRDLEFQALFGAKPATERARKIVWDQLKPFAKIERFASDILILRGAKGVLFHFFTDRILQNRFDGVHCGARGDDWCLASFALPGTPDMNASGTDDCILGVIAARYATLSFTGDLELPRLAMAAAAIYSSRGGTISALPRKGEVFKLLRQQEGNKKGSSI